jgi:hypothetical protein
VAQRPPRKPRPPAEPKTRQKKTQTAASRQAGRGWRASGRLTLFGCALLIGAAGAVAALWWLGVFSIPVLDRLVPRPAAIRTLPAPVGTRRAAKAGKSLAFEENDRLDQKIKQIDQTLFQTLRSLGVAEDEIHFTRITHQQNAGLEWQQAAIEVSPRTRIEAGPVMQKLNAALKGLALDPPPLVTYVEQEGRLKIDIRLNGVKSHAVVLLTVPRPGQGPARPDSESGPEGLVAIVIDDLGLSLAAARCFLALEAPLTLSILPFQPETRAVAEEAHRAGRPILLHLPMEPAGYPVVDPGPGALLRAMDRAEVERRVEEAVRDVPFIIGVNNHMGSRYTEDAERMAWVLAGIKKRGLLFLDSRTSAQSKAFQTARELGIQAAERTVFLDNIQEAEAIRVQIRRLVALARQRGRVVAIGHPYPITCQVLKDEYNYLTSKVELVPITSILD